MTKTVAPESRTLRTVQPTQPWWRSWVNPLRTIRVRLAIWGTVVVMMAVGVCLVAVHEGIKRLLIHDLDQVLLDEARELELTIAALYPDRDAIVAQLKRKTESRLKRVSYLRWLDESGTIILYASENAPPMTAIRQVGETEGHGIYGNTKSRAVEAIVSKEGVPRYRIRVGKTLDRIEEGVNRITNLIALIGLIACLLTPLGGLFIADQAVRPIKNIVETTERLRPNRLNERLKLSGTDDELDQMAFRINLFLDQIAEHLEANQVFVADAAHELRSPLAAIRSTVEVTLRKDRNPGEYQDSLFLIDGECEHLGNLVDQLLQLTTVESGSEDRRFEVIAVDDLVRRAVEFFDLVAQDKSLSLKAEVDGIYELLGDARQMKQLLTNLLDNAIKFTPAGGTITISLFPDDDRKFFLLKVKDTGIGIGPDSIDRIFDRFYQEDRARDRSRHERGNGLGLSICRSIVQHHGGTIWAESAPGQGTTVIARLPRAKGMRPSTTEMPVIATPV